VDVAFFGGSFTNLPLELQERLLSPIYEEMAAGRLGAVRVSARPDAIDMRIAGFLKERGVSIVELGVQSLCDEVLLAAGRGHTAASVADAVTSLRQTGLAVGLQLMPGLPGDTEQSSLRTMQLALGLKPDFLRIYPTLVLEETELARRYRDGSYKPMQLDDAIFICKRMLHAAMLEKVPVIRIGLQPTEELSLNGGVVAGPFHPAFRQLVEGELFFDLISMLCNGLPAGTEVKIASAPERLSDLVGQRRRNVNRLEEMGIRISGVNGDPLLDDLEVRLTVGIENRTGNIATDLLYRDGGCHAC
jgi:histone acetyltransferase (RNA polymerase elongator complex component)